MITNKNSYDNQIDSQKQIFSDVLNKLQTIEIFNKNLPENYTEKLSIKYPILLKFLEIIKDNIQVKEKIVEETYNDESSNQSIAIIYHYPCFDGCYSAINCYLYYKHFSNKRNKIEFFPMSNSKRLVDIMEKDFFEYFNKIYILDKGLNNEDFEFLLESITNNKKTNKLNKINSKIIIIDHHQSSIDIYLKNYNQKCIDSNNIVFIFDKEEKRAVCGLTFDFFYYKALRKIKKIYQFKDKNILNDCQKLFDDHLFNQKYEKFEKFFSENYKKVNYFFFIIFIG